MKDKKEIQLHVNSRKFGDHIATIYADLQEVDILRPTSLQEFVNNMIALDVIVPVEVA